MLGGKNGNLSTGCGSNLTFTLRLARKSDLNAQACEALCWQGSRQRYYMLNESTL